MEDKCKGKCHLLLPSCTDTDTKVYRHTLMFTDFQNTVGQPGGSKNRSFDFLLFLNFVWKRFCFCEKLNTPPFIHLYNEADQKTLD